MEQKLYNNFLAIVPEEEHIIQNCPEISHDRLPKN